MRPADPAHRLDRLPYREVWAADFEFQAPSGNGPRPVCMVGRELRTGRELRLWRDELLALSRPPFDIGPHALFVAYYASAELGCFVALGWPMPARILDLYVEFRARQNGSTEGGGRGLLNALHHFGLPTIGTEEKTEMRDLVMYQNAWTEAEKRAILDYCAGDTEAPGCFLPALLPFILRQGDQSLGAALFRGRYMAAIARMEWAGVPIDVPLLEDIRAHWGWFKERMIAEVNPLYGVYDGTIFKNRKLAPTSAGRASRGRRPAPAFTRPPPNSCATCREPTRSSVRSTTCECLSPS